MKKMNRLLKVVSAVVLALSITACAGSGRINWDSARQVKAGMTQQEVRDVMGKPHRIIGKANNTETWMWVHVNALTHATQSAALTFKDGKATSPFPVPDSF